MNKKKLSPEVELRLLKNQWELLRLMKKMTDGEAEEIIELTDEIIKLYSLKMEEISVEKHIKQLTKKLNKPIFKD